MVLTVLESCSNEEIIIENQQNDEENENIKAIKTLINPFEGIEKYVHIYKVQVQPITSNIIRYCLREKDWIINQEYFK